MTLKKSRVRPESVAEQHVLEFPQHGGARRGAGRKPKGPVAGPSHAARPSISARHPLLVTQRLCADLPSLRRAAEFDVLCGAIADASQRDGFRITHFSVQSNHLHYICEARDAATLTSGMRSLGVMIARRLNRLWRRAGQLFADRFHARALETPTEVRQALAYVLNNARKHGVLVDGVDPFSSGPWFDGWNSEPLSTRARYESAGESCAIPTAAAQSWLLRVGWRRKGLIGRRETPGGQAARRAQDRADQRLVDSIQRRLRDAARTLESGRTRRETVRTSGP
jgi:REP element-mobilizing transposase RayT